MEDEKEKEERRGLSAPGPRTTFGGGNGEGEGEKLLEGWRIVGKEEIIWAILEEQDLYGYQHEVMLNRVHKELVVRTASNERGLCVTAHVGAPLEVVVAVLRLAGWTVTAPEKEYDP
jgi:hypothetical protein